MPAHDRNSLRAAALLGAANGLRTATPLATLAARGRLPVPPRVRRALIAGAGVELVLDKVPGMPPRTFAPSYAGRVVIGAACGRVAVGSLRGALVAGAASAVTTTAGYQYRRALHKHTGVPDLAAAVLEDAVAIGLANLGTNAG